MDPLDCLLDWGTDNPLQAALIHTHLADHEFDEIAQVALQVDGPDEIPCSVKFLKEEWNRCFKTNDFANASIYYLSGIKLLCFSCIALDADEALFKHLAISLNLNLAALELKQGKFLSIITLCFLILEFGPFNTKALFRRPKAELGLHNAHKALCDLREAARIEPNNVEIVKELAKVEKRDCHAEGCNKEVQDSEHNSMHLVNSACGGFPDRLQSVEH